MPYQITRNNRGAYKKFSGFVTNAEFLQSVFETQSDPDYDSMSYSINDFLGVTGHNIEPAGVKIVVAYGLGAAFINPKVKIAIVTVDQQIRDLVTLFAEQTRYPLEFFSTLAAARDWLELAEDD